MAALAVFVIFSILTLPAQSALSASYSQGSGSPDTSLFYKGGDLYAMAKWYGAAGRAAYIHARWTFDLAFPFVYTFFLLTSISWLYNRIINEGSKGRLINLVPLSAMLFDLLENSMTTLVFAGFPNRLRFAEILASVFTPIKWLLVGGSFVLLVIGVLWVILRRRRKE